MKFIQCHLHLAAKLGQRIQINKNFPGQFLHLLILRYIHFLQPFLANDNVHRDEKQRFIKKYENC